MEVISEEELVEDQSEVVDCDPVGAEDHTCGGDDSLSSSELMDDFELDYWAQIWQSCAEPSLDDSIDTALLADAVKDSDSHVPANAPEVGADIADVLEVGYECVSIVEYSGVEPSSYSNYPSQRGSSSSRTHGTVCWRRGGNVRHLTEEQLGDYLGDPTILEDCSDIEDPLEQSIFD